MFSMPPHHDFRVSAGHGLGGQHDRLHPEPQTLLTVRAPTP
jgi:hypothetical protein